MDIGSVRGSYKWGNQSPDGSPVSPKVRWPIWDMQILECGSGLSQLDCNAFLGLAMAIHFTDSEDRTVRLLHQAVQFQ